MSQLHTQLVPCTDWAVLLNFEQDLTYHTVGEEKTRVRTFEGTKAPI